jgi:hypothetical protein
MSYIYRLENNKHLIPNESNFDMNYLSIKLKASYMQLRDIAVYIKMMKEFKAYLLKP